MSEAAHSRTAPRRLRCPAAMALSGMTARPRWLRGGSLRRRLLPVDPTSAPRATCDVLLVEDNLADANLLLWCLADAKVEFKIHVARDSEAAFEHLRSRGKPDLVLLDLNLPGRD